MQKLFPLVYPQTREQLIGFLILPRPVPRVSDLIANDLRSAVVHVSLTRVYAGAFAPSVSKYTANVPSQWPPS
jgi:hypothetical protein